MIAYPILGTYSENDEWAAFDHSTGQSTMLPFADGDGPGSSLILGASRAFSHACSGLAFYQRNDCVRTYFQCKPHRDRVLPLIWCGN